ncbi:unnamed protein product [Penicillium glandicola]
MLSTSQEKWWTWANSGPLLGKRASGLSWGVGIETLPNELILLIISLLPSESSIAALALSNRRFHGICDPWLYRHNVLHSKSSALKWAARNGRIDILQKSIAAGAPLLQKLPIDEPIELDPHISQLSTKNKRNIEEIRPYPILLAASAGHTNIVRYMIDLGVSPDTRNSKRLTPLARAATNGHASLVKYLLQAGARQGIRNLRGEGPIWAAAFHGHADVVEVLIFTPKQHENEPDKEELMANSLSAAIYGGQVPLVQLLLSYGVQVNHIAYFGETPLTSAAVNGNSELVSLLLAHGADPNLIVDRREQCAPLMVAVMYGHEKIARILVPGTGSDIGTRALAFAVRHGKIQIAEILLQSGAPPQFCASEVPEAWENRAEWMQPLLHAVKRNSLELVELLLSYGADINVECSERPGSGINQSFDHAIFWAVEKGQEEMVNLLLERGVDPNVTDMIGQPLLTYAIYGQHETTVRCLLDHGANPYGAVDDSGRKLFSFWPMKQAIWEQLQEAQVEWTKQHGC